MLTISLLHVYRDRRLVEYVYVHKCLKLFTEVKVQIINRSQIPKSLMCEVSAQQLHK